MQGGPGPSGVNRCSRQACGSPSCTQFRCVTLSHVLGRGRARPAAHVFNLCGVLRPGWALLHFLSLEAFLGSRAGGRVP